MKQIFLVPLLLLLLTFPSFAQEKTAGIYLADFRMQDSIMHTHLEGEVLDSIKKATSDKLGEMLGAEVDFIYRKNKKGKAMTTVGVMGVVGGLPSNTFKNSRNGYERDYYIQMTCKLESQGGSAIFLRYHKYSRIHPLMKISVNIYDKDKKLVTKKEIQRGDFTNLREEVRTARAKRSLLSRIIFGEDDEEADKLMPDEILYMYRKTLELL